MHYINLIQNDIEQYTNTVIHKYIFQAKTHENKRQNRANFV